MKFLCTQKLTRPSLEVKWSFPKTTHLESPWQVLGFDDQPNWWSTIYGPGPYKKDNQCWEDITNGEIKAGDKKGVHPELANPYIKFWLDDNETQQSFIDQGKLISIKEEGYDTLVYTCNLHFDSMKSYEEYGEAMLDALDDNSTAMEYDIKNGIVFAESTSYI